MHTASPAWPPWLESVSAMAQPLYRRARGSHDWDHTLRVVRLCQRIGTAEGADPTVSLIAALLHDIGREEERRACGAVCHAAAGARLASPLLARLPLTGDQQARILHCIRAHRFRGDVAPESLEARVVFDADKLDAIGAVGIARAYQFAGEIGARLHAPELDVTTAAAYSEHDTGYREFLLKLRHLKDRMLTAEGRRLAAARHGFMQRFFDQLIAEHSGER
jgi:uncharacterized protein